MYCMHCNAELHRADIFCIRCNTPVLTDDDINLMPNAVTTRYINETQYSEHAHFSGDTQVTDTSGRFNSLSSSDSARHIAEPIVEDDFHDEHDNYGNQKKSNRKASIATVAVVLVAVIGLGIFLLLHFLGNDEDTPINGEDIGYYELDIDYLQAIPDDVASIILTYSGRPQMEFHTRVNETITLRAQILPEGMDYDIQWESSDPEILEVLQIDNSGLEATITGIAAGVADIIVTAGGFTMDYVVFIDDYPLHLQLENAINNEQYGIWITIIWTSGEYNGYEFSFLRDQHYGTWVMHGASASEEVEPIFNMELNAFTVGFPDTTRLLYFFADSTGHLGEPGSDHTEDFIWWFFAADTELEG